MVLLLAAVLTAAACAPEVSGPSPTATSTPSTTTPLGTTTTTIGAQEAAEAFRTCLGSHGVSVDPIPFDGNGRPRLGLVLDGLDFTVVGIAEAVTDCSGILGAGALDFVADDLVRRAVVGQLEAFSECVRAMGIEDFPDPIPSFTGVGSPFPVAQIPYSNPELADAAAICRESVLDDLPGVSDEF